MACGRGLFHLTDRDNKLQIFVPRDNKQRETCYLIQLPKALMLYLLIDSPEASRTFSLVIQASVEVLDEVLDEEGIVRIPDYGVPFSHINYHVRSLNDPVYKKMGEGMSQACDTKTPDMPDSTEPSAWITTDEDGSSSDTSISRTTSPAVNIEHVECEHESGPSLTLNEKLGGSEPAPARQTLQDEGSPYIRLLDHVIQMALQTKFPPEETARLILFPGHTQTPATTKLHTDQLSAFGIRSENPEPYDRRIEAAGEIFVSS